MRVIKFRAWDGKRMFVPDGLKNPVNFTPNVKHMQFTGLHDKNGKEIFQGDVVQDTANKEDIASIEWVNCGFKTSIEFPRSLTELAERDRLKVIGNIYEHPELIK